MTTPHKEITSGLKFPEGPIAMPDGSVILVEIARETLTRVMPDGKQHIIAKLGGGPNGAAMGPNGKIYVCNNGGFNWIERPDGRLFPGTQPAHYKGGSIQVVDPETGKFETMYDSCNGRKLNGPNDIVFDKDGGFWFTDLGKIHDAKMDQGALYYARPDGSHIVRAHHPLVTPNGVGLSPDGGTVWVAETLTSRVWGFSIAGPGKLATPPALFAAGNVLGPLPGYQLLDSLAVEAGGKVCVATLVTGAVTAYDPAGGTEQFETPDPMPTNLCFGGPDMRDVWITCSGTGRLYKGRWPRPGLRLNYTA